MQHREMPHLSVRLPLVAAVVLVCWAGAGFAAASEDAFTLYDLHRMRSVQQAAISPDGARVAYVLEVPRTPYEDEDGRAWQELHVVDGAGRSRGYVTGEVSVSRIAWSPDGQTIAFVAKRGDDEHKAVYSIPVDGGEARRLVAHEGADVEDYAFRPDGRELAYLAKPAKEKQREKLEEQGFKAKVYEEDWRPVRVWIASLDDDAGEPRALDLPGSASELHWSPKGDRLALALAPTSLIDDRYMRRKVHVVDPASGKVTAKLDNPGKLGDIAWSPDGRHLALVSAEDLNDPNEGRLLVAAATGGALRDLLPDYEAHVAGIAWRDDKTVLYLAEEGVWSRVGQVAVDGSEPTTLVPTGGPVLGGLSLARDGRTAAFRGSSPAHPAEVFVLTDAESGPERRTRSNPWLEGKRLATQEVVRYEARDGLGLEGVLIRPRNARPGTRYPLIVVVHGGPEAHISNGWVTGYSRPGQFAAARGFAVFHPNYRGSTGRGVAFSKLGQSDYAGKEFDDLVDGVEHLVRSGLVDRAKVGITGGSYGGFASAWAATALSEHFAASVMFVGISDHVSKAGTTDIPREMFLVHSRRWPWEHWDWFRERSPLYHVQKARTPILILHGEDDPRVHPSQSLQLYRYLKLLDQVPVRLVLYPGEEHGNRKAAGRLDYSLRLMRWMEHYLTGPGGEPPPPELDYGLERLGVKLDE